MANINTELEHCLTEACGALNREGKGAMRVVVEAHMMSLKRIPSSEAITIAYAAAMAKGDLEIAGLLLPFARATRDYELLGDVPLAVLEYVKSCDGSVWCALGRTRREDEG